MIHLGQPKSNQNQKLPSPLHRHGKKYKPKKQKHTKTWPPWNINMSVSTTDELVHEKEKYKSITDDLDQTFSELSAY